TIIDGFFPRFSRRFVRLSVSGLLTFARNIVTMRGVPAITPNPPLATITTAADDLDSKNQASLNGGKLEVALRRASQKVLLDILRQQGNNVEAQSNGDLSLLLSTGFEAVRAPSPVSGVHTPGDVRVTQGDMSGE